MKCNNCKENVKPTMHYCPYCSYDLTDQATRYKKRLKLIQIIIVGILLIVYFLIMFYDLFYDLYQERKKAKTNYLDDKVTNICDGPYDVVHKDVNFKKQGIYQCRNNQYVYYVNDSQEYCNDYKCGGLYEIGYTYYKDVDDFFPNSIYLYRKTGVVEKPSELKIAFVANSEEELINNYSEKLYQFVKKINSNNKNDIQLTVYFNNSLDGIKTAYDKLFLMVDYNTYNVTQPYGMSMIRGDYRFLFDDPYDLISNIFNDKKNYPENARNALKNNRHINLTIDDGMDITFEEFVERVKSSFEDSY